MAKEQSKRAVDESKKVSAVYLSTDYMAPYVELLEELETTRSEYLKSLVLKDLIDRGKIDPKEVRRGDRYLLEL